MAAKKQVKVSFSKEKETKNTVRFSEDEEDKDKQVVGKIYVRNATVEKLGNPDDLEVTIAAG